MSERRLALIDGNNIFLRSRAALKDLQTSDGRATGGVYGSIQTHINFVQKFKITDLVWAFDWGRSLYRLGVRPAYKSNRVTENREDAAPQFRLLEDFLRIVDTPYIRIEGIEGDDILASLALNSELPTYIVSSDHDLQQLADDRIQIIRPATGGFEAPLTAQDIEAKYGLPPARLPEIWALQGDSGDGIEGIPGVGPKTALKMIQKWGGLEAVIENDPRCKGFERRVFENYCMIDLHGSTGINISRDFETTVKKDYPAELQQYFKDLEMHTMVRRFNQKMLWM